MTGSLALAASSAALLSAASRAWGPGWIAWLALVPLLIALSDERRVGRGALVAWIAGAGLGVATFEGTAPVLPWSYPALVAFAALPWAAAGSAFVWVRRRLGGTVALATTPLALAAVEFVASRRVLFGDLANGSARLGYTQADTPLLGVAGWSGVGGATLAVAAINVAILFAARRRPRIAVRVALPAILLLIVPVPGRDAGAEARAAVNVGIVQTAQSGLTRLAAGYDEAIARRAMEPFERLTREAVEEGAELVVWGELVLPSSVADDDVPTSVRQALAAAPVALVGGRERAEEGTYNSAFLWTGAGLEPVYRKRALVPIVEDGYRHGRDADPVPVQGLLAGLGICLDSVHGGLSRASVREGAEVLVFLTDDTFAGRTATPHAHLAITSFRSAETGRPAVFANESGPSAILDARGVVVGRLAHGEEGALVAPVRAAVGLTPYVRFGDWIGAGSVAVVLAVLLYAMRSARKDEPGSRRARPGTDL